MKDEADGYASQMDMLCEVDGASRLLMLEDRTLSLHEVVLFMECFYNI